MTVAAVSMAKDEIDIVAYSVRRMAAQVDFLIVADNGSTDGTREMLADLERHLPLTVIDDPEVGYFQSRKMTALAARAAQAGAEFVIPWDQDECWYSPFGRIADVLTESPAAIIKADLYDHVATGLDSVGGDPLVNIGWRRRAPAPLSKVAVRTQPAVRIHQGNHDADYGGCVDGLLVVRHFPYRSASQFESKVRNGAAAYAATDLPEDHGAHWRGYGRILDEEGPEALGDVFRKWFWCANPHADPELIFDPCPSAS